jgi:hypothetical protein
VERIFVPKRASSADGRRLVNWPYKGALVLTKEALWMMALLSSLGIWAAVWAAAASMASAWLQ